MPFLSTFPHLDIPKCNILSHLFPATREPSDVPIWINSRNPQKYLTPRQLLQWVKRLAVGLDTLGVARGQPVMIFTPNHIFVPVAYLGIVGSGRIFSGANPSYTVSGSFESLSIGAKLLLTLLARVGIPDTKHRGFCPISPS